MTAFTINIGTLCAVFLELPMTKFVKSLKTSLCLLLIVLLVWPLPCLATGEVEEAPPRDAAGWFMISTAEQLYRFAEIVNSDAPDSNAVLLCDIDLNPGRVYGPGGVVYGADPQQWPVINSFSGIFEGNGHTIKGLYIKTTAKSAAGIFAINSGTVRNLKLAQCFVEGQADVGCICGVNNGTVENCSVSDGYVLTKEENAGGICGRNNGKISGCHNNGAKDNAEAVRCNANAESAGGICGLNSGEIVACVNRANVFSLTDEKELGGIAGKCEASGLIHGCLNTGTLSRNGGSISEIGGICGRLSAGGRVYSCLVNGGVTDFDHVGHICGESEGQISDCYYVKDADGNINAIGYSSGTASGLVMLQKTNALLDGSVAGALAKADMEACWGQRLGVDSSPLPGSSDRVYKVNSYSGCSAVGSAARVHYSNSSQDIYSTGHSDANNDLHCDICGGEVNCIAMYNLLLDSDITVRYYARLTDQMSAATMTFTMNGVSSTVQGVRDGEYYTYDFHGVAPQCIGDVIEAELKLGDKLISVVPPVSAESYCRRIIDGNAAELGVSEDYYTTLCDTMVALLRYGGEAQKYLNYKTDRLVSDRLEPEATSGDDNLVQPKTELNNNGVFAELSGAAVIYDSRVYIVFYLDTVAPNELELWLKLGGIEYTLPLIGDSRGGYSAVSPAITASSFGSTLTLTAYSHGVPGASVTYGIGHYAAAMQNSRDAALTSALLHYGAAAEELADVGQ